MGNTGSVSITPSNYSPLSLVNYTLGISAKDMPKDVDISFITSQEQITITFNNYLDQVDVPPQQFQYFMFSTNVTDYQLVVPYVSAGKNHKYTLTPTSVSISGGYTTVTGSGKEVTVYASSLTVVFTVTETISESIKQSGTITEIYLSVSNSYSPGVFNGDIGAFFNGVVTSSLTSPINFSGQFQIGVYGSTSSQNLVITGASGSLNVSGSSLTFSSSSCTITEFNYPFDVFIYIPVSSGFTSSTISAYTSSGNFSISNISYINNINSPSGIIGSVLAFQINGIKSTSLTEDNQSIQVHQPYPETTFSLSISNIGLIGNSVTASQNFSVTTNGSATLNSETFTIAIPLPNPILVGIGSSIAIGNPGDLEDLAKVEKSGREQSLGLWNRIRNVILTSVSGILANKSRINVTIGPTNVNEEVIREGSGNNEGSESGEDDDEGSANNVHLYSSKIEFTALPGARLFSLGTVLASLSALGSGNTMVTSKSKVGSNNTGISNKSTIGDDNMIFSYGSILGNNNSGISLNSKVGSNNVIYAISTIASNNSTGIGIFSILLDHSVGIFINTSSSSGESSSIKLRYPKSSSLCPSNTISTPMGLHKQSPIPFSNAGFYFNTTIGLGNYVCGVNSSIGNNNLAYCGDSKLGNNNSAIADNSTMGNDNIACCVSSTLGNNNVTVVNNSTLGNNNTGIGRQITTSENALFVATNSTIQNNAILIGHNSYVSEGNTSIGNNTTNRGVSSVVLGPNSETYDAYVVSVGGPNVKRRITNVASGVNNNDVVTVEQLQQAQERIDKLEKTVQYLLSLLSCPPRPPPCPPCLYP